MNLPDGPLFRWLAQNATVLRVKALLRRFQPWGQEGMNATVSGLSDDLRAFTAALGGFDQHFLKTDFKFMDNLPVDRAFGELKVRGLAMWRKVPAG